MNWMSLRSIIYLYLAIAPILGAIIEGSITAFSASVVIVAGILFYYELYLAYGRWKSERDRDRSDY